MSLFVPASPYVATPPRPLPTKPVERRRPDRHIDIMMALVAVYICTSVGRLHQVFAVFEPFHIILIAALAILFLLLIDDRRRLAVWVALRSRTGLVLVGLTIWIVLSVPGGIYPGFSTSVLIGFLKTVLMYFVIAGVARGVRDTERLAFMYFMCAAIYAAVVLTRFDLNDDVSRLGRLYYYDANDFAVLAVTAVPLGLHFIMTARPYWQRVCGCLGLPPLIVTIVWSGSRGGFLALLLVTLLFLVGLGRIPWRWRVTGAAALALGLTFSASDSYWARIASIVHPTNDYNETSESGRLQVWGRGMTYMMDNPVLGVGAGAFQIAEGKLSPLVARLDWGGAGVKWSAAHNSFVQIGAELGVPGLVLFVLMIGTAIRELRWVRRGRLGNAFQDGDRTARLAGALQISLAGFAVGGFFLSLGYSEMLYALIAMSISLRRVAGPTMARRRIA